MMVVVVMISHLLFPPYRGTLTAAPPMSSVASVTAGLRDDVGCIWAQAAGSLSPFTAIGAESLSSPGPLHCAAPLHQSSLRPESEGKGQDLEMASTPTPQTCASFQKLNFNSAALINSGRGRRLCSANASQVRQRQQPLRLAPPWCVLTLHAIKKNNKTAIVMYARSPGIVLATIALIETTKRRAIPVIVGVFRHLLTRVLYLVFLDLTLFFWRMTPKVGELWMGVWTLGI